MKKPVFAAGASVRQSPLQRIIQRTGRRPTECRCRQCRQQCHTPCLGTPHDILRLIDHGTYLKKQQEKTQAEIRAVNLENFELRRQLGQKVSTEDVREKMKLVIDGFRYWSEHQGFGWMSDVEVNHWGTLSGRMRTSISHTDRNDEETRKRMADFGFEFEDINEDGAEPIANDHNLQKIREIVKALSPDAIADRVTVNRRGDVPHIEDVTIILREWDCLDPYIKAKIEEDQRRYGTKKES